MVRDGERIAIALVAEGELSLEVGTPEIIGIGPRRERCPLGLVAPPPHAFDQATAIQHGMDGGA
jgi:hypothetical protein